MVYREAGIERKRESKQEPLMRMSTKYGMIDGVVLKRERDRQKRLKELLEILEFDTKSMKDIHSNFALMDDTKEKEKENEIGKIDFADFCACTKVIINDESRELFGLFKQNESSKYIDYRFFLISIVSMLAPTLEMKIKYAFDIFDIDGNGTIDRQELTSIISAVEMLQGQALKDRVDKILLLSDSDGNDQLDYDEFVVLCRRYQSLIFTSA